MSTITHRSDSSDDVLGHSTGACSLVVQSKGHISTGQLFSLQVKQVKGVEAPHLRRRSRWAG